MGIYNSGFSLSFSFEDAMYYLVTKEDVKKISPREFMKILMKKTAIPEIIGKFYFIFL